MNKIIESFLEIHRKEYSIEDIKVETAFEHFINRCIVNKYSNDRFDPSDIMTDNGEKGLDGVAICINGRIVTSLDELNAIFSESQTFDVHFVFIQSKTSEHFDGDEIGTFVYGVKAFFAEKHLRPETNEKMENLILLKDEIYAHSIDMGAFPSLDMYFVSCGKWNDDNGLSARINLEIQPLRES